MAQRHLRIGAPVFRPASLPRGERNSRRQSLHGAAGNEDGATPPTHRSAGLQTGIAPQRGAKLPSPIPTWRSGSTRMAQRHLRIGAPVFRPASFPGGERNSRRPSLHGAAGNEDGATPPTHRSAGLQTGIAAEGRETPIATFAHSWDPIRGRRDAPWIRIRRPNCAQRHAETGLWEFRPPLGGDAGLKTQYCCFKHFLCI